jgi:hypothetical protein
MNYDLWFWLGCYFAIGVVLVLVGRILVKLFYKDKRSDFVKSALAALEEDKSPQEKRRELFKSIATGSLVFVAWPVAFAVFVNELRGKPASTYIKDDEPKFTSEKKDLIEIVNPHEVEAEAKVVDPKRRVPDLPFGHLNRGWKELRRKMMSGDVMWSFKTSGYQSNNGEGYRGPQYESPRNIVHGYAIVRSRKIVGEFLTQWD